MSRRAAVPALALLLLAAAPVPPASAHTGLSGSVPADGATASAPERVVLSFSGAVLERLSAVTVVGPDGTDAAQGDPRLEGTDLVQLLDGTLDPGRWTVSYRVVAADGHPLAGQLAFAVADSAPAGTPAATATSSPAPLASSAVPTAPGETPGEDGAPPVLVGGLVAGGLAAAALLLGLRRRSSGG